MKVIIINMLLLIVTLLILLLVSMGYYNNYIYYISFFLSLFGYLICCSLFFIRANRIVTPIGCYCLSIFVFLLSRPFLSFFIDEDIISVGLGVNDENIVKATLFIMSVFYLINILYVYFGKYDKLITGSIPSINVSSKRISGFFLILSLFFCVFFIKKSYANFSILSGSDNYFLFISSLDMSYFKYFFMAKYFLILYIVFSSYKHALFISTAVLFLSSIGFMAVGLRGYTIAYMFLFILAYDIRYRLKILELVILSLVILLLSASVLSFRLGFDVFDGYNYFSIILKTISQQGATFEVVFGAVNFLNEINSCISYFDYFFEGSSFGDCVDFSRGVNFSQGGFASSFFAELVYFWPFGFLILPLFAFSLRLINTMYNQFLSIGYSYKIGALFVFFLLPNLVYFARSSAFDLIEKSNFSIAFIVALSLMLKIVRKENG